MDIEMAHGDNHTCSGTLEVQKWLTRDLDLEVFYWDGWEKKRAVTSQQFRAHDN